MGDLSAIGAAFGAPTVAALQAKARFRDPDRLGSSSRELAKLLNLRSYPKIDGERRIFVSALDGAWTDSLAYFLVKMTIYPSEINVRCYTF